MSPIIDLQRRIQEAGRIRIGQQVQSGNGKSRPAKLDTFRLTSPDRQKIDYAAALFGGTVNQWEAPAGAQWEVITTSAALDVIVPPAEMAFSQWYEQWSAGGCQRRCDGQTETISDRPCLCDPEQRACDIHTRLSVMLADLPGLGVWRIDTSGYYAAVELSGAVQVVQSAAMHGTMLPARLRLEQRTVKRSDRDGKPQTRRFAVPVLDVEITPGQLLSGATAPRQVEQPERPRLTPVPESLPTGPQQSIAEQVAPPPQRPRRRNAAPEIPASGRTRRPVEPPPEPEVSPEERISEQQSRMLHALVGQLGLSREQKLAGLSKITGREITTSADLTMTEATWAIDSLRSRVPDEPPIEEPAS